MLSKSKSGGFIIWAILATAFPAVGQEPLDVSLDEAVRLFSENGLEMRIARAELEMEYGEARQSRAYFNPTLFVEHENLDYEGLGYGETILALSQSIEWPWRTSAHSRAAEGQIEAAVVGFRADSLRLIFEARRVFLEAWALEERMESLDRAAAVVRDAVRASQIRLADGDISDYDTRRLALEQVRLEQLLAVSELDRSTARRRLAALITPDGPFDEAIAAEPTREVPPPVDVADPAAILARNPELVAAESRAIAAGERARAAEMSWIPPLTLTAGYKDQTDGFTGAVLGVSLPIPLFDRRGGESQAAEARRSTADAEVTLRKRQVENELRRAIERYESAMARLQRLGTDLLSDAAALLETASLAYQEGEFTLLQLIDAAEAYRRSRMGLIDLRAEAWLAYYNLEWAMGGPPAFHDSRDGGAR